MSRTKKKQAWKKKHAWLEARVQSYIATRSVDCLARMIVDLEESSGSLPEFEIDDEWPASQRAASAKAGR